MYQDFLELLQCLNEHKVKYLIIGGYAVVQYAEPRYTKDLDLWVEPTSTNGKKLLKALAVFGAPIDNLSVGDIAKPGLIYIFGLPPARIDILNRPKGSTFATAWKTREKFDVGGVVANFVSKKILLKLKKAAGRAQDFADIEKIRSFSIET